MKVQKRLFVIIAITSALMLYGVIAFAGISCSDLALQPYGGATINDATLISADGDTPAYCKVTANAGFQTDIEVRLPDNWQRRYLHIGGGGFDGYIPNLNAYNKQLRQGYALAASNGGHRASEYPGATFGEDYTLTQDYAHIAIGTTLRVAKTLIAAYYGEGPQYSYWSGCSNGGRGAYNAAAKYPLEYDGIISAAPTRNMAGQIAAWMENLPASILTPAKIAAINASAIAACDKLDGLEDGIISNPDACNFDPTSVPGLSSEDVAVVNNILSDITLSDGTIVYSRFGFGPLTWAGAYGLLGIGHVQWIVYRDTFYDPESWDLDDDFADVAEVVEGAYDFGADTDALVRYLNMGKKLIVWHGTDDTLLSHYDTIRTMEELASAAGGYGRTNIQLYLAPGVGHCAGGAGADKFDMISAITDWVENGKKPGTLLAWKEDVAGNVLFTRPLCEYPRYPHYLHGDPSDWNSFSCKNAKHGQGTWR